MGTTRTGRRSTQRESRVSPAASWWLLGGGIGAVIAVVLFLSIRTTADGGGSGVTDAAAWDLPAINVDVDGNTGERVVLADHGGTPVVVNFFASWCPSCEAELPAFSFLSDQHAGVVDFVFVNSNETGDWKPMARRTGIGDQIIARDIDGTRGNGLYRSLGGTGGMPMTAFYDAAGQLVHLDRGQLSERDIVDRLDRLFGVST